MLTFEDHQMETLGFYLVESGELSPQDLVLPDMWNNNPYSQEYNPPNLSNFQVLKEFPNVKATSVAFYSFYFVPEQDNMTQLLILPYSSSYTQEFIYLDNFEFKDCGPSKTYTQTSQVPNFTYAEEYVVAKDDVLLNDEGNYGFHADEYIELLPGFQVSNGTDFIASIVPCGLDELECATNDFYGKMQFKKQTNGLIIYPNPTSDKLKFENIENQDQILVFDLAGRVVYDRIVKEEGIFEIGLGNLRRGLYIIHVIRNGIQIHNAKIQVN